MNWGDFLYYGVGGINVVAAVVQGRLMITNERSLPAFVELAFYLLLWPFQLIFWIYVGLSNLFDWIGFHLWGGASHKPRHE